MPGDPVDGSVGTKGDQDEQTKKGDMVGKAVRPRLRCVPTLYRLHS